MKSTKVEYGNHLSPLNKKIRELEVDLRDVRNEVERQLDQNRDLLMVKMKLEEEIKYYRELLLAATADPDR